MEILIVAIVVVVIGVAVLFKMKPAATPVANNPQYTGIPSVDSTIANVLQDVQISQDTVSKVQTILNSVHLDDSAGASAGGDPSLMQPSLVESTVEDFSSMPLPIMTLQPTVAQAIRTATISIDKWDNYFKQYGDLWGVSPVIIKSVCMVESTGNNLAFNPVAVDYHDRNWTAHLHTIWKQIRSEILTDPEYGLAVLAKYNMDPSMGLMQVRYSTGHGYNSSIYPVDLFDGGTCIALGARFLASLQDATGDLQQNADAYNMGLGNWKKGRRNWDYLKKVQNNLTRFQNDF